MYLCTCPCPQEAYTEPPQGGGEGKVGGGRGEKWKRGGRKERDSGGGEGEEGERVKEQERREGEILPDNCNAE